MKWFKYGCLGCLGALGLLVLIGALVAALAWQRSGHIDLEERILTKELPAPAGAEGEEGLALEDVQADLEGGAAPSAGAPAGVVVLDLSGADFRIGRGEPGEPVRVEGTFNRRAYDLAESFEEPPGEGWTYRVSFRRKGSSGFLDQIAELLSGSKPRVRIFLPPDIPLALELDVSQGGLRADLGGLWLTSAEMSLAMGGADVRIDEPLRAPMGRLGISGRMGGASFMGVGNASPREVEVEHSMGGMSLDLRGRWLNDSEVSIDTSMGGAAVRLPQGVNLEGLPSGAAVSPREPMPGAPTLRFDVSERSGEIEFRD